MHNRQTRSVYYVYILIRYLFRPALSTYISSPLSHREAT